MTSTYVILLLPRMTIFSSFSSSSKQENSAIQRQTDFHLTVVVVGPAVEIVSRNAVNFQRQTDEALDDEGNVNTREEEAERDKRPMGLTARIKSSFSCYYYGAFSISLLLISSRRLVALLFLF